MDQKNNTGGQKEKSSLEEVRRKLYSKHYKPKYSRAKLSEKQYDIKTEWESGEKPETLKKQNNLNDYWGPNSENEFKENSKTSKNFIFVFIFAALFFFSSLGYAYYSFHVGSGTVSPSDVSLSVLGPVSIGGGEKLSVDVVVQNNHRIPIELVDLVIDYPAGTKNADDLVTDLKRDRIPLGDMQPNEILRKNISMALFGEENSMRDISLTLEYRVKESNAIYEKKKIFGITLNAAPVRLLVDGIREVSSGQEIEITAKLISNSTKNMSDIMVLANYPFGFTFKSSNIKPSVDNNIWVFKNLAAEEEKNIIIRGTLEGQNNEDRIFTFDTGIRNEEEKDRIGIVWGTSFLETKIQQEFANVAIQINSSFSGDYSVKSGSAVEGTLYFYNNTDDALRNIEIEMEIGGDVLDKRSVKVNDGFYNSSKNAIFWGREHHTKFKELASGERLELSFSFAPYNLADGNRIIENPEININAISKAVRVGKDNVEEKLMTNTPARILVLSDISALAYTSYGDGFLNNNGPIPPVAEEDTTYTVILEASNGNNKMENVRFITSLPSYVKWEKVAKPQGANINYNENTRELVWNIGKMEAGTGFISPSQKLYLSITLRPSVSQISGHVNLTNNSKLTGFDTYAQKNISITARDATTQLYNRSARDGHANVVE